MEENSRNQRDTDRSKDRNPEKNLDKRDNRQNTSSRDMGTDDLERRDGRTDRLSTSVPDNYERDSE